MAKIALKIIFKLKIFLHKIHRRDFTSLCPNTLLPPPKEFLKQISLVLLWSELGTFKTGNAKS